MEISDKLKLTVVLPSKADPEPSADHWAVIDSPYFEAYNIPSTSKTSASPSPSSDNSHHDNELINQLHCSTIHENKAGSSADLSTTSQSSEDRVGSCDSKLSENKSAPGTTDSRASDTGDSEIFECGICTDDLTVPKSLPCLHNFCLDCLQKYFKVNSLQEGQGFSCPTCRASVTIPRGGAINFPTNFHIVNLRRRSRELDLGLTIKEAVHYLECRAEEIVDELAESKRQVLINIGNKREQLLGQIEDIVETLQESAEEQYTVDSTKAVDTINSIKTKLSELHNQLGSTQNLNSSSTASSHAPEAIRLNALTKLRRQAEIITNVNNDLEELKCEADRELANILEYQIAFCPSASSRDNLRKCFGKLVMLQEGQSVQEASSDIDEGFSPLHVRSWSQSWWVLLFAVLPAVICALLIKVVMSLFEKLLD